MMNQVPSPQSPAPWSSPAPWPAALDLVLTGVACALWYVRPTLGPWPLLLLGAGRLIRTLTMGRASWRRSRYDLPLLLFGVTAAFGAWLAYDPAAGWGKFWVIVGGLALYDSLARAPEEVRLPRGRLRPAPLLMALLPAVIAAYFLLTNDWLRWTGKLPWLDPVMRWIAGWQPDLPGHRLHPNVAGGLIAGLLPLQAAAVGRRRSGWPLLALAAATLLLTGSRGAWLALGVAVAVALTPWPPLPKAGEGEKALTPRPPLPKAGEGEKALTPSPLPKAGEGEKALTPSPLPKAGEGRGAALRMLAVLVVAAAAGLAAWSNRAGLLEAVGGRLILLQNSLDLALDTPFTGIGLAGFQMAYSSYVLLLHVGHTIHSHNLFLNLWIEQGLPGLLIFLWLLGLAARQGWRSRTQEPAGGGPDVLAPLIALAVIALHGLADDAFYGSRGVLLMFAPFAWLARETEEQRREGEGERKRIPPSALALTFALLLALLPQTRAAFQANLGALFQTRAELSVYRWPAYPVQDALRRPAPNAPPPVDLTSAIGRYRAALALDPANATANRRLGQIELSLGQYDAARAHLAAAYAAAPQQRGTRQLLGESYAIAGDVERAAALWRTVDVRQGQLGLRAGWYAAIGEDVYRQRIVQAMRQLPADR